MNSYFFPTQVLTAIVDGIKAGRPETTRLAAVKALQNSLGFCEANFGREAERSMLMTVVCEATQSPDPKVKACVC
jgi:importin subunit beta-1